MQVRLEAVNFNHDPALAVTDAFNIRKNETTPIVLPEWQRGVNARPEDSLAAYSILDTQGKVLTINASFSVDNPLIQRLSIRAINADNAVPAKNVLGEVAEREVVFVNGASDLVAFELRGSNLAAVGIHDIEWHWQFRAAAAAVWTDFERSSHRIYTTLSLPKDPWDQRDLGPSSLQFVWSEVLDQSCDWARGADTEAVATKAIVRAIFGLGPRFIQFDNENNGTAHYSDDEHFDCTAFLRRLAGQASNGQFVNCTDCASIVTTFANAIGCNLSQAKMAPPPGVMGFPLNPHKRIGFHDPVIGSSFRFHEVAWEGACQEADDVFDACLLLNANNTPVPFRSKAASNLPFGDLDDRHYRFRLVPQTSQSDCLPVSGSAVKRKVGPVPQLLRTESALPSPPPSPPHNFVSGFSFSGFESAGFLLQETQNLGARRVPIIKSFWKDKQQDSAVIRVDTFECASIHDARNGALNLLDGFELHGIQPSSNSNGVMLAFENSNHSTALVAVANMVFLMRNIGAAVSNLSQFALALKRYILPPTDVIAAAESSVGSRFQINEPGVVGRKAEIKRTAEESVCNHNWFSSESGQITRDGDLILYEPILDGAHRISVWSLEGDVISFGFVAFQTT